MKSILLVFAALLLLAQFASPMPLRMRTPERRDTLLSAVCAVQKLQEAVDLVELEQEVRMCFTNECTNF